MPLSNNIGQYIDCRRVLDEALRLGGIEFECATAAKAAVWRHRANRFRRLLGDSPYDQLVLRIQPDSNIVRIELRAIEGTIRRLDGTEPDAADDLEAQAEAFAKGLKP